MTVQTGRRPTPGKKPSREMISNITAWVEGRNMDLSAVWAIATKIQQKGTKLWQSGGRKDIVDPAVEDFVKNVERAILDKEGERYATQIQKMKW
jgi:enoyl-[acyl-carrier-protein] reductase (NADH)